MTQSLVEFMCKAQSVDYAPCAMQHWMWIRTAAVG